MRRAKKTTCTSKVEDALREATANGEFLTPRQLVQITGENPHNVYRALLHFRDRKVAFVVIQDGRGYWGACPPEEDTRHRKMLERAEEPEGNRLRKYLKKPPTN